MNKRKYFSAFSALIIPVAALLLFWQRDALYDQYRLWGYEPPANIAALADQTTMSAPAERLFYVNRPELVNRALFSKNCPASNEKSVVLGCYQSTQRGIYLLAVDRKELGGIEQVTAAHELLHATYDRMSDSERQRINALLTDFYTNKLQDQKVKETIDAYRSTEPEQLVNEMHSILATQVATLTPELEEHFKQYFTDRQAIIRYYSAYEAAFSERQAKIEAYDKQLATAKARIDSLESSADRDQSSLRSQRAALEASDKRDAAAYNRQVDTYNRLVSSYNAKVRQLQGLVADYNRLVSARNAIAVEERDLVKSLTAPEQVQ